MSSSSSQIPPFWPPHPSLEDCGAPVERTGCRAVAAIRHRACPSLYQISSPESAGEWVYAGVIFREWHKIDLRGDFWLSSERGSAGLPRLSRDFLARGGREAGADTL